MLKVTFYFSQGDMEIIHPPLNATWIWPIVKKEAGIPIFLALTQSLQCPSGEDFCSPSGDLFFWTLSSGSRYSLACLILFKATLISLLCVTALFSVFFLCPAYIFVNSTYVQPCRYYAVRVYVAYFLGVGD